MKTAKKVLTILSIVCVIVSVVLLIGAIFKLKVFRKPLLNVLLSFATVGVASAFSLNSLTMHKKNRTIAYTTLGLMGVATLMALIIFFSNFTTPVYFNKVIIVLGMFAVLFNIIISLILKLDKKFLVLQIITYAIILAIDIMLTLQVFKVDIFGIKGFWKIFLVLCILAFGLLCTTSIISRKTITDEKDTIDTSKKITLTKQEYDAMLKKISMLENENNQLKSKLNISQKNDL